MPKINGKELASKLREFDMSFFLAFITSYSDELVNTVLQNKCIYTQKWGS